MTTQQTPPPDGLAAPDGLLCVDDAVAMIIWLAEYQYNLNRLRDECMGKTPEEAKDMITMQWPVIQGTRNQIWLKRIGEMPLDTTRLTRAMKTLGPIADAMAISKVNDKADSPANPKP